MNERDPMHRTFAEDIELATLRAVDEKQASSQRELAAALGVSLGKSNFLIRAVLSRGWVKVKKFKSSDNKSRYLYLLTPSGVVEKTRRTKAFLQLKQVEYDALKHQIEALKHELDGSSD
jgi:MarR family transcriptional regulator, temperature-dependent positive regulator of motility